MEINVGEIYLEDRSSKCNEGEDSANEIGENLEAMKSKGLLRSWKDLFLAAEITVV